MVLFHNSVLLKKAFEHKTQTQITVMFAHFLLFGKSSHKHHILYNDYKMHHETLDIKTLL